MQSTKSLKLFTSFLHVFFRDFSGRNNDYLQFFFDGCGFSSFSSHAFTDYYKLAFSSAFGS